MPMLQEERAGVVSTYLYEQDSYVPLARMDQGAGERELRISYFHCNASGQPEAMTDADGNIVWRVRYSTWGRLSFENVTRFAPKGFEQNLRMQGQYEDRDAGLCYNTFRYYDVDIGRFTVEDPIGLLGGENLYQYGANPLSWIDPLGLWTYNTMPNIDGFQKHHIIPQELRGHELLKKAGFNIHNSKNVIYLPKSAENHPTRTIHSGPHQAYTQDIRSKMDTRNVVGTNANWSKADYQRAVNRLIAEERSGLRKGTTILNKNSNRSRGC
jgi:RHS repeat-associated protein